VIRKGVPWVVVACVTAALASGCTGIDEPTISGSGSVVASPVSVPTFTRIEIIGTFHVTVTAGAPSVTLHVDENVVDLVDVHVSDDILHIGLKSGTGIRDANLAAEVSAGSLAGVDVSGASEVTLGAGVAGSSVDLSASGASRLLGDLAVARARLELSGACHAELSGSAGALDLVVSGASNLQGDGLTVGALTADLSGASSATLAVTDTLSADLSGASSLHYRGTPTVTHQQTSGGSSIQSG
jgi:hypothetical protein